MNVYSVLIQLPAIKVMVEAENDEKVAEKAWEMIRSKCVAEVTSRIDLKAVVSRDVVLSKKADEQAGPEVVG